MNEHYLISPAIELVSPKFKADNIHTFWLVYKIYGMLYHSAPGGFPSVQATAFHRQWCISWLKEEEIGSHRITNAEEIDSQLSTEPALECLNLRLNASSIQKQGAKGWTVSMSFGSVTYTHMEQWPYSNGPMPGDWNIRKVQYFSRTRPSLWMPPHITQSLRLSSLYVPDLINYRSQWRHENQVQRTVWDCGCHRLMNS